MRRCARGCLVAGLAALSFALAPGPAEAQVGAPRELTVTVTADSPTSGVGELNGYTIKISNPNDFSVSLSSVSDELPPGFTYVAGSTQGLTTQNPSQSGQTLTWTPPPLGGSFVVPAVGSATLRFGVRVSRVCGKYTTEATATTAQGIPVKPSGPTAPIEVVTQGLTVTLSPPSVRVLPGAEIGYQLLVMNPNAVPVLLSEISAVLDQGFAYVAGSTSGLTAFDPTIIGRRLVWSASAKGFVIPAGGTAILSFRIGAPTLSGIYDITAAVVPTDRCYTANEGAGRIVVASPPTIAKTADAPQSGVGEINGYTIAVTNPNTFPESFDEIVDTLPAGFSYVAGSTSGAITADPAVSGQTLTWQGPFIVPATDTLLIHFAVFVSTVPGTFTNDAGACVGGATRGRTCITTGPTAQIVVIASPLVTTKTADAPTVFVSETDGYTIEIANRNAVAVDVALVSDTLPAGFGYLPGSTSGVTSANPAVSGQDLTWTGPFAVPARGRISIHFGVRASSVPGEFFNEAGGFTRDRRFEVTPTGLTARIVVLARPLVTTKTADAPEVGPGAADGYTITISNSNGVPATLSAITDVLPPGFSYAPGSTTGVTTGDPAVSDQQLSWSGPFTVGPLGVVTLHFGVTAAQRPGVYFNRAGGVPADSRFEVASTGLTAPIRVKGPTVLIAHPALVEVIPGAVVFFPRLSATLSEDGSSRPIVSQRIVFSVSGRVLCRATTDIHGVAACGGLVEEVSAVLALGYHAAFEGSNDYFPASDEGHLVEVAGMELP